MDKEELINVFILKSVLRDNRLTFLERLLLIHVISLCKKNGYIDIEINNSEINNSKRIIKLSEVLKKRITSIQRNANASIQNNFNHYNKNKIDILDKVYYVDKFDIEYWHGEPIESKKATNEEQEEMEKMLESFKEMDEDIN